MESWSSVGLGLQWLARHQNADGSWSFDHRRDRSRPAKDTGACKSSTGATSLALLSFLGSGHTHTYQEGKYRKNVSSGLSYLLSQAKVSELRGVKIADLRGGDEMFWHALATLTLCEAYGMTQPISRRSAIDEGKDAIETPRQRKARHLRSRIKSTAQMTVNFIIQKQDRKTGAWRPRPERAPDTSTLGWQLMALKSAHLARLNVSPRTLLLSSKFLDSVTRDHQGFYGQTKPGKQPRATSMALLSRLYLGWRREHPGMTQGIHYLGRLGPSRRGARYNLHTTMLIFPYRCTQWQRWNRALRDQLVGAQQRTGDDKGSWFNPNDVDAPSGGRLMQTALCVMALEIYYRHLQILEDAAKSFAGPE